MNQKKFDETIKILMLGESGVGKSSILTRFVDKKFSTNFITTLGVEYKHKLVMMNEKKVFLQVWDTAGQEKFRTITPVYYRKVDGVVMVYDITDENSFESINYWMKNLYENADQHIKVILVGNKYDLADKRVITKEAGEELASNFKIKFVEASAKSTHNVDEVFMSLSKEILEHRKTASNMSGNFTTTVEPTELNIINLQEKPPASRVAKKNKGCLDPCCGS